MTVENKPGDSGNPTDIDSDDKTGIDQSPEPAPLADRLPTEIGGQAGPEPTRYGDWEKNGRCTDF